MGASARKAAVVENSSRLGTILCPATVQPWLSSEEGEAEARRGVERFLSRAEAAHSPVGLEWGS